METPLGDEDLRAIGRITANFALLELMMSNCIWLLVSADARIGQIITAELSFRRLLVLFSSLYRHKASTPQAIDELDALLSRVVQAEEKRNQVTHSIWGAGHAPGEVARIKATAKQRKGFRIQIEEMTTEDLHDIADFISKVATDVQQFWSRLQALESKR